MADDSGALYLSCARCDGKAWSTAAISNSAGRIRIDGKVYPVTLTRVEEGGLLEVAWRWVSADHRLRDQSVYYTGDYRATPLKIGDRVYTATSHGQVVALNAATGAELWIYDPQSYMVGIPNMQPLQTRGIE
jgi:quinoprotein glucose dehydrogenase